MHLTPILSKIAEKVIGKNLRAFLQTSTFGKNQWAFTPGLGSRDLVTKLIMEWILAVCCGKKVGAYLSDISGAFDRVCKEYLLSKLNAAGVGALYLNFLDAYLNPRQGQVVVEGEFSELFEIANSVFQGTVLGPSLWNTFFADVSVPASSTGGKESIFADDLNVFQKFDKLDTDEAIMAKLEQCRKHVHKWGRTNRVTFDGSKEHMIIIHPRLAYGDPFKLLGLLVDAKLLMRNAVDEMLTKIRPRIKALLRTRGHYSTESLILQFKSHIWGLMEAHSGGIFHAATSILNQFDKSQRHFLEELGESEASAFLKFNFAPPTLRRNIAVLGMIHKKVLGKCHPSFEALLPSKGVVEEGRHSKQIYAHWSEVKENRALFNRSIFGMVDIYNNLPQLYVELGTVSVFQAKLTSIAKLRCERLDADWSSSFCRRGGPECNGADLTEEDDDDEWPLLD